MLITTNKTILKPTQRLSSSSSSSFKTQKEIMLKCSYADFEIPWYINNANESGCIPRAAAESGMFPGLSGVSGPPCRSKFHVEISSLKMTPRRLRA